MELKDYRDRLDQIDDQIVSLFKQRMETVQEIADYKRSHNTPVLNAGREDAILCRVTDLVGEELQEYVRCLFITLMKLSRDYQTALLSGDQNEKSRNEEF